MSERKVLSVSELTRQVKGVLELGFTDLWLQGEISNFKHHTSGHLYFTLKDDKAQISAVMWRSRAAQMLFRPSDGMKVMVRGNITVYEPRGNYQFDCLSMQPLGKGELQIAFEQLKQRLFEEGLFRDDHKKELPEFPRTIAIVTSPTGAAIRDMISVLTRRQPSVEVIVVPVKVQGIGAAEEIAAAVDLVNERNLGDLIIVGRGGGSLEDLWAFNEEVVARAVYASRIPVISAVGHEVDFSICDFVADQRAPTPSAAAEMAVKDRREVVELIRNYCYTMTSAMKHSLEGKRDSITRLLRSYSFNRPTDLLRQRSQQVDELHRRLGRSLHHSLSLSRQNARSLDARIRALDPRAVLKRGYAIVRKDDAVIDSSNQVAAGQRGSIEWKDGIVEVEFKGKRS